MNTKKEEEKNPEAKSQRTTNPNAEPFDREPAPSTEAADFRESEGGYGWGV